MLTLSPVQHKYVAGKIPLKGVSTKHLGTLGLCLMAALSLMAFAGATQASALWLENGATIAANLPGSVEIVGLEAAQSVAHIVFLVPNKELELLCKKITSENGILQTGTVLAKGTLNLTECKNFQKKVESKGCTPSQPIVMKILIHLILHNTLTYFLFEPESGTKFTTMDYNEETCALPDADFTGTFVTECLGEKYELHATTKVDYCLQELVNHLITEASHALFPSDGLKYGANEMLLDGVLNVFLNTKLKWSGHV